MNTPVKGNHTDYLKVLIIGCLILVISNGGRSSWGLFMPEMNAAHGWSRESFSLAIAIQNIMWGIGGFFLGAAADKYGSMRTLLIGAVFYVLGFIGMAYSNSLLGLYMSTGVMVGIGIGGTSFGIILATLGKIVPAEKRTFAFGICVAAGSFGQFAYLPSSNFAISSFGWQAALLIHAGLASLMLVLAFGIQAKGLPTSNAGEVKLVEALRTASSDRSFHLLFWGYFVCGLQVVFIGLHLPAYLIDKGMTGNVGSNAIAIVGLFNIIGSLSAGWLGTRMTKKYLLAGIYVGRSIVMILFLLFPLSTTSVYLFAAAMGLFWLSTVPPTNALVGQIYGVKYLGLLGGVVFLGHQIGSFMGAWLGGRFFDTFGSYDYAWVMVISFGAFAALMHAPVNEKPLAERRPLPTVA